MRAFAVLLLAVIVGCSDSTAPAQGCVGVRLASLAPITVRISDTIATTVYDTVAVDPDITMTADQSRSPIVKHAVAGHLTVPGVTLRVFNSALPPTVIPVAFFVRGLSAGADTIVVTTSITGPQCRDGASQQIAVTVTP